GGTAPAHLECKVVWRREFGTTRKEPVPAGFGVQVTGGNIEAWSEACPRVPSLRPPLPAREEGLTAHGATAKVIAAAAANASPDVEIKPRAQQSSVEAMLASVLNETIPEEEPAGSAPLSIDGDAVVEVAPPNRPESELQHDEIDDLPAVVQKQVAPP